MRWLALDLEGDGQSPTHPVEIGVAEVVDLELTGVFHRWRVRPPGRISPFATRIHGIRDADVVRAPWIKALVPEIRRVLGTTPILGHNPRGDFESLARVVPGWQPEAAFDSFRLAKRLHPGLELYRLTKLGEAFGLLDRAASLSKGKPHGALYDAVLSALVAEHLLKDLGPEARRQALSMSDIFQNVKKKPRKQADDEPALRIPGL